MVARNTSSRPEEPTAVVPEPNPYMLSKWEPETVLLELAARAESLKPYGLADVRVVDAGEHNIQFTIDDVAVRAASFGGICTALDVPTAFLKRVPFALAQEIVESMQADTKVLDREVVFNVNNGAVVGYRPAGKEMPSAPEVFERIFDTLPDVDGVHFFQNDVHVDASIVCKSLDIEPKAGDLVRGGISCFYSEVGIKPFSMRAYSERLICTNGMTHREFEREFGLPEGLAPFLQEIGIATQACYDFAGKSLEGKMRRAAEFEVNGPQAIRRIFDQSRLPPRFMSGVLAAHMVEDDGTMFGVLQSFTRAANNLGHANRQRLQLLAGDELRVVERAHCPNCYASA